MESTLRGLTRNRNVKHPPRSYTSEVGRAGLEPATNGLTIGMAGATRPFLNHVERQAH